MRLADAVGELAREVGATKAQVALSWVISRNLPIAAIPGTRKIERLEENWASMETVLSKEHKDRLDALITQGVTGNRY